MSQKQKALSLASPTSSPEAVMAEPVVIEGVAHHYDWGSRTAIPTLLGQRPDGRPVAELWFGAHPSAPSPVPTRGTTLEQVVDADPQTMLGRAAVERFGHRLPFLLKILAADKALSIQVHPAREQARAGFDAENTAGIPHTAPHRNYRDPNHKPELLCALTPFDAMCGFRPLSDIYSLLSELALPELEFLEAALKKPEPLRAAFTAVLAAPERDAAVAAVSKRVADVVDGPMYATRLASQDNTGDIGILLSLLLNYVRLQPGDSIYLGAGNIHAYLRGTAVEIMANSDNVLRCGLTAKHIDIPELLHIADFSELPNPRMPPSAQGHFEVPVPDFRLTRMTIASATTVQHMGPRILLCTSGTVDIDGIQLTAGAAIFLPASLTSTTIDGDGTVFIAGTGDLGEERDCSTTDRSHSG
jgi:mannose-6-phosphate isomerase